MKKLLLGFAIGLVLGILQGCPRQAGLERRITKLEKDLIDARLAPSKERYERWIREAEQESRR